MVKDINDWTVEEVWKEATRVMNENPGPFEGMNVIYQFNLSGDDGGQWQLQLKDGKATVEKGAVAEPMCTLELSVPNFKKLIMGKLNGTTAFMTGKLKVKGNFGVAFKLDGLLKQYNVSQMSS